MALSYQLKVDGEVVETVTAESPLRFVYGTGFLLPAFEKQLEGFGAGRPVSPFVSSRPKHTATWWRMP